MNSAFTPVDSAADGLALEATAFAADGPVIRLWTPRSRALVCPANLRRSEGFDKARHRSAANGWPVYLRPTGGGAVPQGPGVLNLALAFTADRKFTIEDGYRLITRVICDAIPAEWTTGATPYSFCDGAWNMSLTDRKVVGTAQRIRPIGGGRRRILAHALILVEGDIPAGAAAVGAFHRDLGLGPVKAEVHTTLETALPTPRAPVKSLAASLYIAARREVIRVTPHSGSLAA